MSMSVAAWRRAATKEHDIQAAVLEQLRLKARAEAFWFSIPNAGKRGGFSGVRMKREGLTAGVFDLCIMASEGRVYWLELKTRRGRVRPEQRAFLMICSTLNHSAAIVHSLDEALDQLRAWGLIK